MVAAPANCGTSVVTTERHQATPSLTVRRPSPATIVDLGGATGLVGYAVLAWASHDFPGGAGLPGFFGLLAWVTVPWLLVFLAFRDRPESLPAGRLLLWAVLFRLCGETSQVSRSSRAVSVMRLSSVWGCAWAPASVTSSLRHPSASLRRKSGATRSDACTVSGNRSEPMRFQAINSRRRT